MNRRLLLSVGVVGGVAVWWFALANGGAGAPRAPLPVAEPKPETDRAIPLIAERLPARRHLAPPAQPPAEVERPAGGPEPEEKGEVTMADQRLFINSRFVGEKFDTAWAATAGREISEGLAKVSVEDVRVKGVECRSSLCRVEIASGSSETALSYLHSWVRQGSWAGPGFMSADEINPDGSHKAVLFLGRPGTEMPHLE